MLLISLGSASFATPARADEADASVRMAARELAVTGAEAYDKQDYVTALERFQRAEALFRAPSISVMLARCLARVGRVVEAVDKYEETRRTRVEPNSPEAFQRAVAEANAEIDAVKARVARLELKLPSDAPAGVEVRLDDKPVQPALLGVDIPIDPGPHRVVARAPGRAVYSQQLSMADGARQELEIVLDPLAPPSPSQPADASSTTSGARPPVLAIALLSGGGLAIAGGAITGFIALGHKSDLDRSCTPACPASMQGDIDAFRLNRTLSYVGFGVGLAAVGVGTYFLLHRSPSGSELRAQLSPNSALLTGTF